MLNGFFKYFNLHLAQPPGRFERNTQFFGHGLGSVQMRDVISAKLGVKMQNGFKYRHARKRLGEIINNRFVFCVIVSHHGVGHVHRSK